MSESEGSCDVVDGTAVAKLVPSAEGSLDGRFVGRLDGIAVKAFVGLLVGTAESNGCALGKTDETSLGIVLGKIAG